MPRTTMPGSLRFVLSAPRPNHSTSRRNQRSQSQRNNFSHTLKKKRPAVAGRLLFKKPRCPASSGASQFLVVGRVDDAKLFRVQRWFWLQRELAVVPFLQVSDELAVLVV